MRITARQVSTARGRSVVWPTVWTQGVPRIPGDGRRLLGVKSTLFVMPPLPSHRAGAQRASFELRGVWHPADPLHESLPPRVLEVCEDFEVLSELPEAYSTLLFPTFGK